MSILNRGCNISFLPVYLSATTAVYAVKSVSVTKNPSVDDMFTPTQNWIMLRVGSRAGYKQA